MTSETPFAFLHHVKWVVGKESGREQNEGRTSGPGTIHLGSQVQSPDAATPDLSQN